MSDDDQITHAADTDWLAQLRAAVVAARPAAGLDNEYVDEPLRGDEVARFADDMPPESVPPDNGVTLAGGDVLEQVRQAVAATRSVVEPPEVGYGVDPLPAVEPSTPAPQRPAERWSPPPRLKPAATPQAQPLLLPDNATRPRRRTVAIVAVALIAVGVLIGRSLIGSGSDSPAGGSVPDSSPVAGSVAASSPRTGTQP